MAVRNGSLRELRFIFWETTVACNLECIHCRRLEVSKVLSRNDLSTVDAFVFIEGLARDFDPKPVLVLSGGEPLARHDLFDLTYFARKRGVPVALATNGTLVDLHLAKKIVGSGIRRVSISLDGATSETHDQFRKMPGSFEKAVTGFKHLKSLGMSMQLNATLTRHNVHELEAIYHLSLELGAESLHYFLLVPVGCGLEIKEEYQLSSGEYEEALLKTYELASERKIHIRPICAPHYFRIVAQKKSLNGTSSGRDAQSGTRYVTGQVHKSKDLEPVPAVPGTATEPVTPGTVKMLNQMTKGCLAATGICFVSHKGEVFPCGYLPVPCGNIRERNLKEIWETSLTFESLRKPDLLGGKCGVCEFRRMCSGCRARAFEEENDFLAEEPNCLYEPKEWRLNRVL
ncbi:MAG: radical SAM protein [Candidatus Omnitrophica bacterium]|nr:radical SAM protein [Candidatus Omnitrophota bacterium]